MNLSITMHNPDETVIERLSVTAQKPARVSFECFGSAVTFDLSVNGENLNVSCDNELCMLRDGIINLLDCSGNFTMELRKSFTLVYPAMDMMAKFDFNY